MTTPWTNPFPKPIKNVSLGGAGQQPNLSGTPNWKITHGTINGSTPVVTGVVAPVPTNAKSALNGIKTYLQSLASNAS